MGQSGNPALVGGWVGGSGTIRGTVPHPPDPVPSHTHSRPGLAGSRSGPQPARRGLGWEGAQTKAQLAAPRAGRVGRAAGAWPGVGGVARRPGRGVRARGGGGGRGPRRPEDSQAAVASGRLRAGAESERAEPRPGHGAAGSGRAASAAGAAAARAAALGECAGRRGWGQPLARDPVVGGRPEIVQLELCLSGTGRGCSTRDPRSGRPGPAPPCALSGCPPRAPGGTPTWDRGRVQPVWVARGSGRPPGHVAESPRRSL